MELVWIFRGRAPNRKVGELLISPSKNFDDKSLQEMERRKESERRSRAEVVEHRKMLTTTTKKEP